ncbi:hypothetical protein TSUD_196750 [Trifolium subterraneum]|uniref:F-box domain-containing protein n=1 Tax=Trifolium subterraneum TaxID=3900 RepID=A0A2Z6P027_TRISU|nr:hypothetical protein TSUD_196750 [Trifolium subterraneum]
MMETTKKNTLQYLPHELIIQILLRLPVKYLIRFKCVCKLWFSLISDSHFANSHFQITAIKHTPKIMFISNSAPHETLSIDFESSPLHYDSSSVSLNPNCMPPFQSYPHIEIKGSCRGFLLLHCYDQHWIYDIYLWNPSTGFHKKIPLSPFSSKLEDNFFYGFGYDHSTDDYLLVSMSYDDSDSCVTLLSHLGFFSLKTNTWKEIEDTHDYYIISLEDVKAGLLFNGTLHWFGYGHDDLEEAVIIAFDLRERKLLDIHLPDDFYYILDDCGLWVSGEFLSVWAMDDNIVEIWVMKEYQVHSSWTKTIVLPLDVIPNEYFTPLRSTKSGDIIGIASLNGLGKYNDKGQLLEYHSYCNDPYGSQMALYIESLLSLPPDSEQA